MIATSHTMEGWDRVEVQRRGDKVEIAQANYDRTGCFVQVEGLANLDRLISDLKKMRKKGIAMTEEQASNLVRDYRAAGGQRKAITLPGGSLGLDLWETDTGGALAFWTEKVVPLNASSRNAFLKALLATPA
jgi:hypothetical protein